VIELQFVELSAHWTRMPGFRRTTSFDPLRSHLIEAEPACGPLITTFMDTSRVLEILKAIDSASIRVWLDGGWGVDALLGEKTRDHDDLDIIVSSKDAPKLKEALFELGFRIKPGSTELNFVLVDRERREVDVHPVEFAPDGYAYFPLPNGRVWPFPPAAFAGEGRIDGREVECLSPDAQVQCHGQGYEPTENDLRDMERLQRRFGVVLPINLCRQRR
jgi:lincosamide nucleotidyltransferase A/C/D/E